MAERRPNRTLGPGHDEFWAGCARGELRLPACVRCGDLAWPIAAACERCGGAAFRWRRLSGDGRVVSACAFHQDYYGGTMPLPYDVILVELAEGVMFVSNPVGLGDLDGMAGRAVRVAFLDCEDDAGPFRLPVFGPA